MYKGLIDELRLESVNMHYEKSDCELFAKAADAIEELIAKLNHADDQIDRLIEAAEERRWIPVEERLPDADGFTLIFTAHGNPGVCYFTSGWWGGYDKDGITHWMPLPQAPEEE